MSPRIVAHATLPRSYCSDRTCGGTDCTTCHGLSAEVLFDVFVDGRRFGGQWVAELDADDDQPLVEGLTVGDLRLALRVALNPPALAPWKPAPGEEADDVLPF